MKNAALLFVYLFGSTLLIAQNPSLAYQANIQQEGNWIEMLPDTRVSADDFFDTFLIDLGLDADYHFELLDKSTDALGFSHYRYREHFKGSPVEGGTYILHVQDGFVSHANGKLIRGIPENGQVTVSAEDALDIAKNYMGSEVFFWEVPGMEALIKRIKKNPDATYFPQAELVYAQSQFTKDGSEYRLAWKFEIYAASPDQKKTVFVDAISADVLFALEGCHGGSVEGEAETRYHGTQTIITDSISATEYRLIDDTRGGGIETYDMNQQIDDYSEAVDFTDEDNYWDNANAEFNDAATDAHWGAEMFYDYLLQEHGRDSYDDNGTVMVSYVHYDENYFNAFWNGSFVTYGDGNDNPLTAIDVVGHEFTHGVTGTSAGLIYQNESGALSESFSDVFGAGVEHFALGDEADWLIGAANFVLRDMSNPNEYGDPDTYQGTSWVSGPQDNGGVHSNSGVQNFWFYLLSEGGTGTNDNGDDYVVDSLGMEKAAAIAYRNLTTYLTESSNYTDARNGAIQAAEDLYGTCSYEVIQVAKAWHAVGVGPAIIGPDFQFLEVLSPLYSSCDLGAEEQVSMIYRFNPSGCGLSLEPGDEIVLSYRLNSDDPIVETIVLTETLNDGETITHEFGTTADLSIPDQHYIDYSVSYVGDLIPSNNAISNHNLTNPLILEGGNILSFENFNSKDSIYLVLGVHAEAARTSSAANTGNKGFLMNGFDVTPGNITVVETEDENYAANPDFTSKMCACVDLAGWDEAYLNFDLRQTYSDQYEDIIGFDIDHMIAMRTTVNGGQIGGQFHPQSNYSDPYLTHQMDMSVFAGSSFTLCFESVNFINEDEDDGNEGDKSTLDNIYFSQSEVTGLDDQQISTVDVYPNPTTGWLTIELDAKGVHELDVLDIVGNIVQNHHWNANDTPLALDLSDLAKGTYMISIRSDTGILIRKVVLE